MKKMNAKILLVDDEALVLLGWEHSLRSAGYDIRTAMDAKEAIKAVCEQGPDIVITDLIMPDMNGIELCRKIKALSPGTDVVLLTGFPGKQGDHQRDFIEAGGRDIFLIKPLSTHEIIRAVEAIMKERS